jgi:hypothetical protein
MSELAVGKYYLSLPAGYSSVCPVRIYPKSDEYISQVCLVADTSTRRLRGMP